MKRCTGCRLEKPVGEFYRKRAALDGRQHCCKPCSEARKRVSRAKARVAIWRPTGFSARPALMVIQQLALEWGSERDAAKVLALRDGSNWQAWERAIERWRESGTMTEEAADRFACAAGRHVEELWGRERGAA